MSLEQDLENTWSMSADFIAKAKVDSDSSTSSSGKKQRGKCPTCRKPFRVEDENLYPHCSVECKYAEMEL